MTPVDLIATFPHLCDDKMSEEELKHYRMKLYKETLAMKSRFDGLVFHLQRTVQKSYQVKDIARLLKSHEKDFEKPFCECTSISDVFDNIAPICSFYNFNIIKFLTRSLGTESNKKKLEKFIKKFREYAVRRICECPINAFGVKEKSEKCFRVKTDKSMDSLTVDQLDEMQFEMNKILGRKFLRLLHIEEGCVLLVYRCFSDDIMDLSIDQQMNFKKLGILNFRYGDRSMDMPDFEMNDTASTKDNSELCT